jgi:hypothetical protein
MNLNQTSGNLTLPDEQMAEVAGENQPLSPDHRKTELRELLLSLNCKLEELAQINSRLSQMTTPPEKKKLDGDDLSADNSLRMTTSKDTLTEPVLTYRLSWLLDFLRGLYGFEDCGVFLLSDRKGGLERLVISSGTAGEFEDGIEAFWRRGDIDCAVSQKRRIILPAKKEGNFLIIPFKILNKKDGFWMAHFKKPILPERKSSADLLFWVELFASCIENSYLKKSSLSLQKEKSYHNETEKLFTTAELSKAVVHEINSSLQIILSRTQLLKMSEKKSQKMPSNISNLKTIEGNGNRICSILKDFSDHLHRQFDETTDAGEVNIQHILKSNLVLLKYILKSNRIKLEVNLDDDLPTVYGNPGELELALLSLIWGLRDQLPSGESIRLQTSTEGESLCLNIYCAGKEMQTDECPHFTDLKANDRFMIVSQILGRYHGDLKFEKLTEREMRLSLRFPVAAASD